MPGIKNRTPEFAQDDFQPCIPTTAQRAAFKRAMAMLSGKWKMDIVFILLSGKPTRFSELRRRLPQITQRMLTAQLRALEGDGLILRHVYPEIPVRVEYTLTRKAYALGPMLLGLVDWVQWSDSDAEGQQCAKVPVAMVGATPRAAEANAEPR